MLSSGLIAIPSLGRWLLVALAFVFELAGYAGTGRTNRDRLQRA
jgi:hypothetical protein